MNLTKVIFKIFLSIVLGYVCGKGLYNIYSDKIDNILDNNIYLLEVGSFSTFDMMKASSSMTNYVYYDDNGVYKKVVAITRDKDNIDKVKKLLNEDIVVNTYVSNDRELNLKIDGYDKLLLKEEDISIQKKLINEVLSLYKSETSSLVKMNY